MKKVIEVTHDVLTPSELLSALEEHVVHDDLQLEVEREGTRSAEPAVLVALISSGASVITTLIMALVALAKSNRGGKIVIVSRDGERVEMPASADPKNVEEAVSTLQRLDRPRIILTGSR
jgi:hypothetical protein